jgi:hypothetical protein
VSDIVLLRLSSVGRCSRFAERSALKAKEGGRDSDRLCTGGAGAGRDGAGRDGAGRDGAGRGGAGAGRNGAMLTVNGSMDVSLTDSLSSSDTGPFHDCGAWLSDTEGDLIPSSGPNSELPHCDCMSSSSRRAASVSTCPIVEETVEGVTKSISCCKGVAGEHWARRSISSKVKAPESLSPGSKSSFRAAACSAATGFGSGTLSFGMVDFTSSCFEPFQKAKDGML